MIEHDLWNVMPNSRQPENLGYGAARRHRRKNRTPGHDIFDAAGCWNENLS